MKVSLKYTLFCVLFGVYLYLLLPATATAFYELYHLTHLDFIYWAYSFFKLAGYYFSVWEGQLLACVLVVLVLIALPIIYRATFTRKAQ